MYKPYSFRDDTNVPSFDDGAPIAVMAYGLYALSIWPAALGTALVILAKVWFCDRMVWLYEDMRKENAVYASWVQRPVNDNRGHKAA